MFYVLAIALCLAVLFLVFTSSSFLFFPVMLLHKWMIRKVAPENAANLLFAVRLLPFAIAAATILGLALPAFLEFEPYSTHEGIGVRLNVLAMAGGLLLAWMVIRGYRTLQATKQTQRLWIRNAQEIYIDGIRLPIYRVESGSSLLAVAGIFRPQIFLSREIAETLSPGELKAALEHETAHVTSFDNLKQLLLRITRPPHWLKAFQEIDTEWGGASEIAADYHALARGASVLDLSSALIKVGRLSRGGGVSHAVASHLVPPVCNASLEQRIIRLSDQLQGTAQFNARPRDHKFLFAIVLGVATYIACFQALLPAVHEVLEVLVR